MVEIGEAIEVAQDNGCSELAILHCVSGYPAPITDYNLNTIPDMINKFGLVTGISDHTLDNINPIAATALGASIYEKHFTIDKNLSKKRKYNHLLRIAINKKIISISLRKRVKPKLNFNLKLVKLKREKPKFKNLKYKKILSYLTKMDNSRSDIALVSNKKLLETGTSNLLFVKDQKFFTPKKDYYEGNTYKFFKTKITKIFKKDILLKEIKNYDEILLIGSGKGVASVRTINELKWKRKNLKTYNDLNKIFLKEIKRNKQYVF